MCAATSHHVLVGKPTLISPEASDSGELVCAAFQCSSCNGMSVALTGFDRERMQYDLGPQVQALLDDALVWRPTVNETRKYPDVPDHIAAAATEAFECNGNQHYRAAILLARAVIEATAKAKGVTAGNLEDKIDALAEKGHIRPLIKEAAHGVRVFGNEMAHGDFVNPVTKEESTQVIHLMGEILDEAFQQPAKVEEM
jgi:hypothetical protein